MFENYVVLITGAGSGIGYSSSRLFIEEQGTVIGADLDAAALDRARAELGERFLPRTCDVCDEAAVGAMAAFVEREIGKLDVLVNNAGRGMLAAFETVTEDDFYWHYDVLVKGPILMVKHFAPLLRKSHNPSIVNISSQAARIELSRNHFLYSTAKAALLKLTRHLVRDLPGIRANAILPGWVDTPIYSRAGLDQAVVQFMYDQALARIPVNRIAQPEDIAHCILFLSSEKASYINGAAIDIDGGWSCNGDWGAELG